MRHLHDNKKNSNNNDNNSNNDNKIVMFHIYDVSLFEMFIIRSLLSSIMWRVFAVCFYFCLAKLSIGVEKISDWPCLVTRFENRFYKHFSPENNSSETSTARMDFRLF